MAALGKLNFGAATSINFKILNFEKLYLSPPTFLARGGTMGDCPSCWYPHLARHLERSESEKLVREEIDTSLELVNF